MAKRRSRNGGARLPASPTISSLRSSRASSPGRSAASSASPGPGGTSSPTPTTIGSSPAPWPTSSTATSTASTSLSRGKAARRSSPLSPSCRSTKLSHSWTAATAFSSAASTASPRSIVSITSCAIPATKKWFALPDASQAGEICTAHLDFDPAVSSHFHVLSLPVTMIMPPSSRCTRLKLKNGFTRRMDRTMIFHFIGHRSATIFLNGCLHFLTLEPAVATVGTEEKTWRNISVPDGTDYVSFSSHRAASIMRILIDVWID